MRTVKVSKKIPSKLSGESSIPFQISLKEGEPAEVNVPPTVKPTQTSYSESLFHVKEQPVKQINRKQTVKTKLIIAALGVFILTGLFPPWQFTTDKDSVNGSNLVYAYAAPSQGVHSHKSAGYSLIFTPPVNPDSSAGNGIQIDFGRLSLEWAMLAAIAGIVWMLVVKPAWSR